VLCWIPGYAKQTKCCKGNKLHAIYSAIGTVPQNKRISRIFTLIDKKIQADALI